MNRKITVVISAVVCAAVIGGLSSCNRDGEEAPTESITAVTADSKSSVSETSQTEETPASAEGLTISPSGYLLDPKIILGNESGWNFQEKQPCLIGEPAEEVRFYGVNGGEERVYNYTQPLFGESEYDQYTIIEHDGTADEFACLWTERFGSAMSLYPADFDGDGETEIASVRYSIGGTWCSIMELAVYKINDGHYERFGFDLQAFNDEYIIVDIDDEERILTLSANGFDKTFTYDFSEIVPPEMTEFEVHLVQINDFVLDGGEITYIVTPLLSGYAPETFADIRLKLKFSDGVFTCSGVEFSKNEALRPAEPEYAVDFDTAVSNIIAAGVEAKNSEFVLSGTEDSDGETYYRIIKGFDNGEAVAAEDVFRVNTENGSAYIYLDPTLPMSDYAAQFKSENDKDDPQSRYIQIYDGKP